jgi:predicted RNase H-like HicB family nuclease
MEQPTMSFSAIFLESGGGFVGFIEELPGINSYGRSIDETRAMLRQLVSVAFDEERRSCREMLDGKLVLREELTLSLTPTRSPTTHALRGEC